jgi:hypothetical protein
MVSQNDFDTSDVIRPFADDIYLNCAQYGLQTWYAPTQESRVLAFDIRPT